MIGGVSGAKSSYVPQTAAKGSEIPRLEQQKNALKEEIKRVKENDKLEPDAKKRKLDMLTKKQQKIEAEIQKASAAAQEENGTNASVVKEAKEESLEEQMQEKKRSDRLDGSGEVIDTYV